MKKLSISAGNSKLGAIPSVSLPPCTSCNPGAPCFSKCYAARLARLRPNVREAYQNNADLLSEDPAAYWLQLKAAAMVTRFFRYHVAGDIPNEEYFYNMVALAWELPHTQFLAFTKQWHIVNAFLDNGGRFPQNLKIIFSNWGAWKCPNPYNLPVAEVIFKGETPADSWKICGGSCTACVCRSVGCWELKDGETIAFYEH